jgi:hypothetical protein
MFQNSIKTQFKLLMSLAHVAIKTLTILCQSLNQPCLQICIIQYTILSLYSTSVPLQKYAQCVPQFWTQLSRLDSTGHVNKRKNAAVAV